MKINSFLEYEAAIKQAEYLFQQEEIRHLTSKEQIELDELTEAINDFEINRLNRE